MDATESEIKSYKEHLQKHKPQKMITQYACLGGTPYDGLYGRRGSVRKG